MRSLIEWLRYEMNQFRTILSLSAALVALAPGQALAGTWSVSKTGVSFSDNLSSTSYSSSGNDFSYGVSCQAYAWGPTTSWGKISGSVSYTATWTPSYSGETPPFLVSGSSATSLVTFSRKAQYNAGAFANDPDYAIMRETGAVECRLTYSGGNLTYSAAMTANAGAPSTMSYQWTNGTITEFSNPTTQVNLSLGTGGAWQGTFSKSFIVDGTVNCSGNTGDGFIDCTEILRPTKVGSVTIASDLT